MGEWNKQKIADIITLEYGRGLKNYRDGIGNFDVFGTNGKIGLTTEFLYDQPSIIIGRKGAYREVHFAKEPFFVIDTAFYTKNRINDLDTLFLYYWFKNVDINELDSGSAIPSTSRDEVYDLDIHLPCFPEQKAIASVLSSLDEKIELLYRQNKTLETMAETLFRQWFVEEARKDWEDGVLGDIVELAYGKGLRKDLRTGMEYPVVGSSGIVGYHSEFLVKSPGIVIGRKGTLGKVIYLFDNFFPIDTTYYVKSKINSAGLLYEYFLLKTINFDEMNSDSAVPGLNRDIALSTDIKLVPMEKIKLFSNMASPIVEKLKENYSQIQTLEKLRNTLLPKLMSGEVRVEYNGK
ncbi:MAG: restriction endonuclease subunit S [Desulfobacteraceae bacterium]|nr:restriction endonuclease subunit S [Desulfobacteraceae bacterium]